MQVLGEGNCHAGLGRRELSHRSWVKGIVMQVLGERNCHTGLG